MKKTIKKHRFTTKYIKELSQFHSKESMESFDLSYLSLLYRMGSHTPLDLILGMGKKNYSSIGSIKYVVSIIILLCVCACTRIVYL